MYGELGFGLAPFFGVAGYEGGVAYPIQLFIYQLNGKLCGAKYSGGAGEA